MSYSRKWRGRHERTRLDEIICGCREIHEKVGGTDFNIKTNIKTERWGEALVTVDIPKRNNPIAIMRMDANEYCSRHKGFRRDGKLYLTYMLRIEKINAED